MVCCLTRLRTSGFPSRSAHAVSIPIARVWSHSFMASWEKAMAGQLHRLDVDHSEHQAALLEAVRRGGAFDVQMVGLLKQAGLKG